MKPTLNRRPQAPVSLVVHLRSYLEDPNFEANRVEYKANKEIADGKTPSAPAPSSAPASTSTATASARPKTPPPQASSSSRGQDQSVVDFFASIEQQQPTMFNPQVHLPPFSDLRVPLVRPS